MGVRVDLGTWYADWRKLAMVEQNEQVREVALEVRARLEGVLAAVHG
jgi:hypothetical protein